jgi:glycosyltransferase involved in cell wall biosynthesis
MPTVDVVIPCYKYAHFLEECVRSVLTQEGVDVRVLIIDDCSPDNTPEVGTRLAAQDKRVEFRRHPVNRGHVATYNEGLLEWAQSEYCLLLSADDLLTPGALSRAAGVMESHPEVGLVYGRVIRIVDGEAVSKPNIGSGKFKVIAGEQWLSEICEIGSNSIASPEVVVRRELQQQLGGYRRELPHSNDMEMWLRFASVSAIGVVDADQAFYRIHNSNMHSQLASMAIDDLSHRRMAFDWFFRTSGARLANSSELIAKAHTVMANEALSEAHSAYWKGDRRACRQLMAMAVSLWPQARQARLYRRLTWMLCTGSTLWSLGRTLRDRTTNFTVTRSWS